MPEAPDWVARGCEDDCVSAGRGVMNQGQRQRDVTWRLHRRLVPAPAVRAAVVIRRRLPGAGLLPVVRCLSAGGSGDERGVRACLAGEGRAVGAGQRMQEGGQQQYEHRSGP
ncbi:hypothetical protein KJK32_40765 [Streptomyces sp. JCM17656]|nr:hypothetical protein KJK32_40765 [Streptomyces sp. JCM17656]